MFPLKMNEDARGSFTELLKTEKCGQVSVNISKPGITKGQHWHNTKNEKFVVVKGHGLIQLRKIGSEEIINYEVSGDEITVVFGQKKVTVKVLDIRETTKKSESVGMYEVISVFCLFLIIHSSPFSSM